VYRATIRIGLGAGLLVALLTFAAAQDKPGPDKPVAGKGDAKKADVLGEYPEYFTRPQTVAQFWEAIQFELELGKRELAARLLHEMLKVAVNDQELVELEQKVGNTAFLRLRLIPKWSDDPKLNAQAIKDADELNAKVSQALQKILGDRTRILRFIRDLNGDREDRDFATKELYRSGALAVPVLVSELQSTKGEEHQAILSLLPRLAPETVPPLIAALDIDDNNLRVELIDVLEKRGAREAVPFLWYYAGSPRFPDRVRSRATQALAYLTGTERARLPTAPVALTREAERYYHHQVPLDNVAVWRWDDKAKDLVKGLPGQPIVPPSRAEEYYGLRFAREALDIDPLYLPAQQVFLSLLLEKGAERAGSLDKPLPADVRELAATVNPDLVIAILERALDEHRLPVVLGAVRALGDLAETRALRPTGHGEPALVRALSYPDRRVQMAAVEALLRIPASPSPTAAGRVVDVLRRFAAIDPQPRAKPVLLLGFAEAPTADAIEKAARQVGFDVEKLASGNAVLTRLKRSADVDALLIGTQLPDPGLAQLLAQLREDPSFGGLPLWLVIPWDSQESLKERQYLIEEDLRAFRRRKQALVEERARTEANYLSAKGNAANPFKIRLDRIDKELESYTQEKEDVFLAARKAVERQLLSAPPARELALRRLLEHYRNTWLLPESAARDPGFLRRALAVPLADAAARPLTEAERKTYAERSLYWLGRMARGEVAGYDISPAADALYRALAASGLKDEALVAAVEATGRLPALRGGDRPQRELATVVLDAKRSAAVRGAAASELLRRIQRYSPALTRPEVQSLEALRNAAGTDPKLREAVALVIGATRPDARLTGERLKGFEERPPAAPPKEEKPAAPKEEKPKEDKP
jgi:hypothetical protein